MLKEFLFSDSLQLQVQSVLVVGSLTDIYEQIGDIKNSLITDGNLHPTDYYQVDEAISVEDFKLLIAGVYRQPLGCLRLIVLDGRYLNLFVQNSLLKILEESPANNCFILLADKSDRWLETVKSRCRVLNFVSDNQGLLKNDDFWIDFWNQDGVGREKIFKQLLKNGSPGWENDFLQTAEQYFKDLLKHKKINLTIGKKIEELLVIAGRQSRNGVWINRRLLLEPIWLLLFEV
ncbi:MAG: hypothetical protein ACOCU8_00530 [Patescibacteria group bacterium]